MTYKQQREFLISQRRLYVQMNLPYAVQMVAAILASVEKAERFTRKR